MSTTQEPRTRSDPASEVPRLSDGLELIGEFEGSGLKDPPLLARRADGQVVQLHPVLYAIAEQIDGHRTVPEIAERVSSELGRRLAPDDLAYVIDEKLRPLGVVRAPGQEQQVVQGLDPLLALKLKTAVVPDGMVRAITTVFRPLFLPPVVVAVLLGLAGLDYWLFVEHGIAQSVRQILLDPLLMLMVLGLVVIAAAFHECGHATATRYGGATPGAMGVGLYIVWPAFYTDITDSYRLGKGGRLRADLGGVYFNVVFILLTAAAYAVTGFEPILLMIPLQHVEIVHQFLPFLRLDGYYIISDLTGVPDMFARVKPVLVSLIPGREADPRVEELKRWARLVVTAWVLVLVPVLLGMFALMAVTAPRVVATAWSSLGDQWHAAQTAWAGGAYPNVLLACVQALALVLPAVGLVATFWRLGARASTAYWARTAGRPAWRVAGIAVAGTGVAFLALALWPRQQYTPIQPGERGTLASAAHAVRQVATSDPTGGRARHDRAVKGEHHKRHVRSRGAASGSQPETGSTSGPSSGSTDAEAPQPVTGLSAEASQPDQVLLSWTVPADVDSVIVRRGDGGACPSTPSAGTPIGSESVRSSQADSAVSDGATYCYSVFSANDAGSSEAVTTTVTIPSAPPSSSTGG